MIRRLFPFWGAEDGEEEDPETPPEPTGEPSTRELTAEEIEKMTARAADRAARKARKDLVAELGFDDLSKAKEFVSAKLEADKNAMDEKDRAIAEAEQAKRETDALRSNLASDRLDTTILRHVVATGISDQKKLDRVTALVRLDLDSDLINDEESWDEAIAAALSAVKEDTPELFTGPQPSGFGSGDGGARGPSDPEKDPEAEQRKKYESQYAAKGFVEFNPDDF